LGTERQSVQHNITLIGGVLVLEKFLDDCPAVSDQYWVHEGGLLLTAQPSEDNMQREQSA